LIYNKYNILYNNINIYNNVSSNKTLNNNQVTSKLKTLDILC
jgi:hypothetical protein